MENNKYLNNYEIIQLKNIIQSRKRTYTDDIITETPTKWRNTYGYRDSTLNMEYKNTITKNNQYLPKYKMFQLKNKIQSRKRTYADRIITETPARWRNTYVHRDYTSTIQCNRNITDISLSESTKDDAAKKCTLKH